MKVKKIYLDMDGVLSDFEGKFSEIFGESPHGIRERKDFTDHWPTFVEQKQFENLNWFPGGEELVKFVRSIPNVEIEILSSSGGMRFQDEVKEQKKNWLKKNGLAFKAHVVPGRKKKAEYATPETILIDDTEDVIVQFNQAGGIGILHRNVGETVDKIKLLLDSNINI